MRVAFAALLLAASIPASAQSAQQDWNQTYAETGKGHRVGNPDAPVQLIEFVSYTCPHCANYAQASEATLRLGYVGEGKAAVEVRHVIRNQIDLAAALVTECGPASGFFDNHRLMLRSHEAWMAKGRATTPAQRTRWQTGTMAQQMQAIAHDLDFDVLMEPRGFTVADLDRCLADEASAQAILAASEANSAEFAVPGTPSFAINGALQQGVHTWESLEPLLATPQS